MLFHEPSARRGAAKLGRLFEASGMMRCAPPKCPLEPTDQAPYYLTVRKLFLG